MPPKEQENASIQVALGLYLASIRADRGLTLRQVEEKSDKAISNAYLSQIEKGLIKKPSPNVLHLLAEIYAIDYAQLMERAGYVMPAINRESDDRHGRIATFAEHNLTRDEEQELMEYLKFIRNRKK